MESKNCKVVEAVILTVVLAFVVGLFTVPIIIFGTQDSLNSGIESNLTQCHYSFNGSSCDNTELLWTVIPHGEIGCPARRYTGSLCYSLLQSWQYCAIGDMQDVFVHVSGDNIIQELDGNIQMISDLFDQPLCQQAVVLLLCQYTFPLCDCNSGDLYLPSQEECLRISNDVCGVEWSNVTNNGYMLPNCSFLNPSSISSGSGLDYQSNTTRTITCSDDFFESTFICLPQCDAWVEYNFNDVGIAVELSLYSFGIVVQMIVLIISIVNYNTVLTFPSILLFYFTIEYMLARKLGLKYNNCPLLNLLVVLPFFSLVIGHSVVLCGSESFIENFNNPTTFCTIAGAVSHYTAPSLIYWWFAYIFFAFFKINFPFISRRITKTQEKCIHLCAIVIGVMFPIPAVIAALSDSELIYRTGEFSLFPCSSTNNFLLYFSLQLILNVLICVGTCLLIVTIWKIHKQQGLLSFRKNSTIVITTAEKKLLLVMCYFGLFGIVLLINLSIKLSDRENFSDALAAYFFCEQQGLPNECDRSSIQKYQHSEADIISVLILATLPLAQLLYIVNYKKIKECITQFKGKKSTETELANRQ